MTAHSIIGGVTAAALLFGSLPSFAQGFERGPDGYGRHGDHGRVAQRGPGWQGHREWREHEHEHEYRGGFYVQPGDAYQPPAYVYQQPGYVYQEPAYAYQDPAYVSQQPGYYAAPSYYGDQVDPGAVAVAAILGGIIGGALAHR